MNIISLHIKNIGPFKEANLEFNSQLNGESSQQPVTIITGNNGAGKSIIIDAIRVMFDPYCLERDIIANKKDFEISMDRSEETLNNYCVNSLDEKGYLSCPTISISPNLIYPIDGTKHEPIWIVDYWSSKLPSDSFKISNLETIKHEDVFKNVFKGKKSNLELTNFICSIDYLRSSDVPKEKEIGEKMYDNIKTIINKCLNNGEFKYIRRTDLTPIVSQNGHEVTLDQLSSGNLFLLEHLLLLLCKMYSVCVLNNLPVNQIMKLSGFILIDEIENHLHPQWQKKILCIIRDLFPNIQIILTTHSPFVLSSIKGAKVYTCVPSEQGSTLEDNTEYYNNLPVDEVLVSKAFGVSPFNDDISEMLRKRKELIKSNEKEEAEIITKQLYEINPEAFMFLNPNGDL